MARRTTRASRPELTPEQKAQADRIHAAMLEPAADDLRELAELLATKDGSNTFGATEFTVRDIALRVGAEAIEAALDGRKKGGTTGRPAPAPAAPSPPSSSAGSPRPRVPASVRAVRQLVLVARHVKQIRGFGWVFVARLRGNRLVRLDRGPPTAVEQLLISTAGTVVWLPGFGLVQVFRAVARDGDAEYWVTNDVGLDLVGRVVFAELSWAVEEFHRGLKPFTGAERCQVRYGPAQRIHFGLAIRAFVRLEWHRFTTGISWFEAKLRFIRRAVRAYLAAPTIRLPQPAAAQLLICIGWNPLLT